MNRRRQWTTRIVLESHLHEQSAFVTLTYSDRCVPVELKPSHMTKFLKRLRRRYEPAQLRYFYVGEYGDRTWRPHYHACLFGVSVADGELVQRAWPFGFVHMGELNEKSAMYCAGYVCKKMTMREDPRLLGRHPEFARMSLKPGIGRGACVSIAKGLTDYGGSMAILKTGDVPDTARVGGRKLPIGRYLRRSLRHEVGWESDPPEAIRRMKAIEKSLETDDEVRALERKRKGTAAKVAATLKIKQGLKDL